MQKDIYEKLERIEQLIKTQSEQPLNLSEACKYLDISESFLYKLTATNQITFYKPNGKRLYFLKSDLNKWLLRNPVKSKAEIDQQSNNYLMQ